MGAERGHPLKEPPELSQILGFDIPMISCHRAKILFGNTVYFLLYSIDFVDFKKI